MQRLLLEMLRSKDGSVMNIVAPVKTGVIIAVNVVEVFCSSGFPPLRWNAIKLFDIIIAKRSLFYSVILLINRLSYIKSHS